MNKKLSFFLATALIPFFSFSNDAYAVGSAGFENASFSTKSLGQGNAVVAQADEPAAISYNPAGIVDLPGLQFQGNTSFLSILTYRKSSVRSNDRSSGTIVPVPTGYLTLNPGDLLGNRVAFGIGSDSPFGLLNKYSSADRAVHYTGWKNWLKMYTIKPTISFKLLDWLSIGGGPMWYRVFDYGGMEAYPNKLIIGGLADGQVRVNMAGNHWGWQAGVLAKPHKMHQFGFYFRSPVVVKTRGLAKVENTAFTPGGTYETGADSKLSLPMNLTFAYAFKPTDRLTAEADLGYTKWSIFKRASINHNPTNVSFFDNTILGAIGAPLDKDYSNGFSINVGGNYKFTDKFTLLFGSWYYWKVVPKDHWIPAVPDSNRLGFALGTNYKAFQYLDLGMVYSPSFSLHRPIDNNISEAIGGSVDGKYFTFTQEATVSFTYHWDNLFNKLKRSSNVSTTESVPSPK